MNQGVKIAIGAAVILGLVLFTRKASAATTSPGATAPNVMGMSQDTFAPGGSASGSGVASVLPGFANLLDTVSSTISPAPAPSYTAAPPPAPAPAPIAAPAPTPAPSPYQNGPQVIYQTE